MSKSDYLTDLEHRIQSLENRMKADKQRLAGGSADDKVKAAGDLAIVESRLAETREKLARLQAEPEGAWEDFKAEIEQDIDYIEASFDRWVEGRS